MSAPMTPERWNAASEPMSDEAAAAIRSAFVVQPVRQVSERILELYHSPTLLTADEWAEWDRLCDEGDK